MKKQLLFLFLMMACGNQDTLQVTRRVYAGTISGEIPIVLTLTRDGEPVLGNVAYKEKSAPITILGSMSARSVRFDEFTNDGSITGIYSIETHRRRLAGYLVHLRATPKIRMWY